MTVATENRNAIFRTDGGPSVGGGHVTRCFALAQALRSQGWRCAFAASPEISAAGLDFEAEGIDLLAADDMSPAALAEHWSEGCDLFVVDHYGLGAEYESACRGWARRILAIDDLADRRHDCDLLLDPTLGRAPAAYDQLTPETCAVHCGPDYALLRPQFAAARTDVPADRESDRLLVALGGTDPDNATAAVLDGLRDLDARIDVVVGASAPHLEELRAVARDMGDRVALHAGLDAAAMAALMARASLAVGAAGSTAWERCALGLPSLLVVIADNQRDVAAALSARGAAINLGEAGSVGAKTLRQAVGELLGAPQRLADMARAGRAITDARGAERLATLLSGAPDRAGGAVRLRAPARADRDAILDWQRDPSTRRHFHNPEPPSAAEHSAWFESRRADPEAPLYIIECDGIAAGTLRLDRVDNGEAASGLLVSILIGAPWRGRGVAGIALGLAHAAWPESTFLASVKPENETSHRLFLAAGYAPREGEINYSRQPDVRPTAGTTARAVRG